ncbi:hypothetical protein F442_01961 [Phytophthora nicotianae P10297]|uniref:Uncharacterized protein n=1 Tax=Phytophthora nicotianae P10297 TaxID=1317064 RepID=W3A3J7_PHYNI|nr:hypothetical protein F442_01961 [Phytophthora nicotianae P10297]
MGSGAPTPRRLRCLHFLLLGSLLYTILVLLYSVLSVHLSPSLHFIRILDSLRRTPEQRQADNHALQVGIIPSEESIERQFKCVGWRATADCSHNGPRLPELDRPCTKTIPRGHCELQDENTGELFKVARRTCADWWGRQLCSDAWRLLGLPIFAYWHMMLHGGVYNLVSRCRMWT